MKSNCEGNLPHKGRKINVHSMLGSFDTEHIIVAFYFWFYFVQYAKITFPKQSALGVQTEEL